MLIFLLIILTIVAIPVGFFFIVLLGVHLAAKGPSDKDAVSMAGRLLGTSPMTTAP